MSMMPPQVRPTANASSSLTPYRSSTGRPSSRTCWASSYTAPSTQPPDTLPDTVPSSATSIAAPGARGADENVATTVPSATRSPAEYRRINSASTSRTADLHQQLLEGGQAVAGKQPVNVRQCRRDSRLDRRVPVAAGVRVHPQHPVRQPAQPRDLLAEQGRVTTFPAVREQHDGRPAREPALAPAVEEHLDRLAEAGAAGEVGHRAGGRDQGLLRVPLAQLA